jgi:hypothetical protein
MCLVCVFVGLLVSPFVLSASVEEEAAGGQLGRNM